VRQHLRRADEEIVIARHRERVHVRIAHIVPQLHNRSILPLAVRMWSPTSNWPAGIQAAVRRLPPLST